jgi:hypothetical protein
LTMPSALSFGLSSTVPTRSQLDFGRTKFKVIDTLQLYDATPGSQQTGL